MQVVVRAALALLLALAVCCCTPARAVPQEDVKLVSACASNLSDPQAPVLAPLSATFGADAVKTMQMFLTDTPVGKALLSSDASTCLANLNDAKLSDALTAALATPKCSALRTVGNLPFVRDVISNMTAKTELVGFTKLLRNVSSDEYETFCSLYVDQVVPCVNVELLPAIATLRAKFASGCCDAWATSAVRDFSYTVSDLITKVAQLFGDVTCSRQTPSFLGNASQTCAYTFAQTALRANDSATLGADLIVNLQVPTDQMCLQAEGKAYVDVNGAKVAAAPATAQSASGCVVALDRAASWVAALPLAQRTNAFDIPTLFATTKCLKGSEFFPVVRDFFPSAVTDVVGAYFSKACVHVPIKYADKCTYSRSASLVDWVSEPAKVKASDLGGSSASASKSNPTSNIMQTKAPVDASAASAFHHGVSSIIKTLVDLRVQQQQQRVTATAAAVRTTWALDALPMDDDDRMTPVAGGGYHNLQTSRAQNSSSSSSEQALTKREMKHAPNSSANAPMPLTATAPVTGESSQDGGASTTTSDYRVVPLPQRIASQPTREDAGAFCSNVVITSKYTTWNFLPLFMVESFRKLANAYFLLVSVLQTVPNITNTGGLPSNLPVLMFILAVDGVLAIIEDRRRHRADNEANSAQCHVVTASYTGTSTNVKPTQDPDVSVMQWADLTVGTIVKLRNRETAPADLLILAVDEVDPSDPNGICYVETKSLDGETNLKLRQACDNTLHALTTQQVTALAGYLRCENPNKVIGRFDGTLTLSVQSARPPKHQQSHRPHAPPLPSSSSSGFVDDAATVQMPVSIKNVLLRGCQLRNTDWIFGLVINTGPDTKIMQSSVAARPKWSSINETVNKMIIWLFFFLCALCAAAATAHIVWMYQNKSDASYLGANRGYVAQWFISFGSYFLLMYQMIPVSLYVTISMVMFIQAIFMTWDIDMYYSDLDVRMIVRSMGLNEELGQISYVFSDKTGTLTCNVMEFRKCSINGISYGTGTTEIGRAALRRKGVVVAEEPSPGAGASSGGGKSAKVPYVNFEDARLFHALERDDRGCPEADFFLHLSLCQTVIPEVVEGSSEVRFSASSPDEQALVSGAKFFGFSFESRGLGIARIRVHNKSLMMNKSAESELQEFKILDVLEFTSDRKRMSVVVQYPNGEFWVLTKGADNMIYPLLSKSANSPETLKETMRHLETFGDDGLRTLTIARRRIDEKEYVTWSQRFKEANASLEEIEKRKTGLPNRIDELMCEIEKDLVLLGATAIEDKLQNHVPRAIANLMKAGMKVWMLTGDKQETAINISYACQLMDNDMKQIVLNCELFPTTDAILAHLVAANAQAHGEHRSRQAVVIDGECLELTLLDDRCRHEFLTLAMSCEGVVCCRVSPSQKAEVVTLVRATNTSARTLAIGDGANDVAMIQRAHVGVGICGMEGMQAVNSSDYAIGQFYFLEKLLLHHGRLNYKRMSILVGYMFYKNIVMVLAQYYYMVSSNASGQKFYSEVSFQLYNIAYTSLPIIVLGVFDYDVPWSVGRHFPQLYLVGPRMELFNNFTFFKWVCSAVYEAFVIFIFVIFAFNEDQSNQGSAPLVQYGLLSFTCVVLVANLKLTMLQMSWSVYGGILWFLGVLSYLPVSIIVSSSFVALSPLDYGSFQNTLYQETYWFVIPICCVVCLLRHFAWTAIQRRFYPLPWQIVQEYYVLSKGKLESAQPMSTTSHIDVEAGIPMVNGMQQDDGANYFTAASPTSTQHNTERTASQHQQQERKQRISSSSGFAYSYDPQTAMAESYISTHSMASAASALSDAEHRGRTSREDSRSSDFSDAPQQQQTLSASVTDGSRASRTTPGLFV